MNRILIPALTLVTVTVVMAFMAWRPKTVICEAPALKSLPEIPGYTSEPLEVSEAERNVLPGDTQFDKKLYKDERGHWYAVSLVIGGTSKSSIHRPELCLPSQGFLMVNPRTVTVEDTEWRFITLDGGIGRQSLGFAYTFFNQAGYRTSSHTKRIFRDVWDRSILSRVDRWAMITVNSSHWEDSALIGFLAKFKGAIR